MHAHSAAEQRLGIEPAQHRIRIGHRGQLAAAAIGRRTGIGARALRPDLEQSARVYPGDRAAPGADGMDIKRARAHREAAHQALALLCGLPFADQAHVGRGAAHVEGNKIVQAQVFTQTHAADDAARRSREERVDRELPDRAGRHRTAVGLHDTRHRPDAEVGRAAFEALEIAVHDRHQARVYRGGGEALEFAELSEHFTRTAEINAGPQVGYKRFRPLFMRRVGVSVHKADRDRLDLLALQALDRAAHVVLGKRRHLGAVVRDAAADLDAAVARRRRHRLRDVEVEVMRTALACELERVAKTRSGDEPGRHPLPFNHCVGGERRAEHEKRHIAARETVLIEQFCDAVQEATSGIRGRGWYLVIVIAAAFEIDRDQVGEGAAGVHADPDHASAASAQHIVLAHESHGSIGCRDAAQEKPRRSECKNNTAARSEIPNRAAL